MSRIYEALQRAEFERKVAQEPQEITAAEPVVIPVPGIEEPPPAQAEVVIENVGLRSWKPLLSSLPTLEDHGANVEQFRGLRSRLYQIRDQEPLKTILICSGMPGEGKTFVTANLAMSLARNKDNRVLLIDGDLRRSTLHHLLGAPNTPGLSEYLAGTSELNDVMQRDSHPEVVETGRRRSISNLTFIPAGMCGDNSSELVANHKIDELISTVAPHFDWIVIDSSPVLPVTDAVDLARACDAVLLVARGDTTPFDVAQRAQAAFRNSRLLGFVLNAVKNVPRNGSYYGSYETEGGYSAAKG